MFVSGPLGNSSAAEQFGLWKKWIARASKRVDEEYHG